jgi:hypothetical protein
VWPDAKRLLTLDRLKWLLAAASLIALSRIHLGVHYVGEVIAGLMTAALPQLDEFKFSLGDAVERVLLALLIKDVIGNGFPIVQMPLPDRD